jgi:hypothetical protein
MSVTNDIIAALAFVLVGPALLFVAALCLRNVPPAESETARFAERILRWYAAHPQFALWVLFLLFPLSAFVLGSVTLLQTWGENPKLQYWAWRVLEEIPEHWPAMSVGGATLVSAGLLVMITAHLFQFFSPANSTRARGSQ